MGHGKGMTTAQREPSLPIPVPLVGPLVIGAGKVPRKVGSARSRWGTDSRRTSSMTTFLDFADAPHVDILSAGAPCQPYSAESRRGGASDPRAGVVAPLLGYLNKKKPMEQWFGGGFNPKGRDRYVR